MILKKPDRVQRPCRIDYIFGAAGIEEPEQALQFFLCVKISYIAESPTRMYTILDTTESIPPRSEPTSTPARANTSQLSPPITRRINVSLCMELCVCDFDKIPIRPLIYAYSIASFFRIRHDCAYMRCLREREGALQPTLPWRT